MCAEHLTLAELWDEIAKRTDKALLVCSMLACKQGDAVAIGVNLKGHIVDQLGLLEFARAQVLHNMAQSALPEVGDEDAAPL